MPVVVRYQTKPERAEENQALIEAVVAELRENKPRGFTYEAYRLADGVSFVHVVNEDPSEPNPESLQDVSAFQAFTRDIADRCDVQPAPLGASLIGGGYR